jgi:hypothetical protein
MFSKPLTFMLMLSAVFFLFQPFIPKTVKASEIEKNFIIKLNTIEPRILSPVSSRFEHLFANSADNKFQNVYSFSSTFALSSATTWFATAVASERSSFFSISSINAFFFLPTFFFGLP